MAIFCLRKLPIQPFFFFRISSFFATFRPIVTISLIALMVTAHIEPIFVPFLNYSISSICLDPMAVFRSVSMHGDYVSVLLRLFGSAFVHGSDSHLFYNMSSLLWKGATLEHQLGTGPFGVLVLMLLAVTNTLFVVAGVFMHGHHCAIGFSGVLFALKYYSYHNHRGPVSVWGLEVAPSFATWLELGLVQLISPQASLLGHACGILAGAIAAHFPHLLPFQVVWFYLEINGILQFRLRLFDSFDSLLNTKFSY